jgi:hypothetical protein
MWKWIAGRRKEEKNGEGWTLDRVWSISGNDRRRHPADLN